jgi:hypothetical protein
LRLGWSFTRRRNLNNCLECPYFQISADGNRPEGIIRKVEEEEEEDDEEDEEGGGGGGGGDVINTTMQQNNHKLARGVR